MSFWSERRVLITGATGLLGFWLTKALLERDAYVVALVRDQDPQSELLRSGLFKELAIINGDLDAKTIERALCHHEIQTIFHLAAQTLVQTALRNPLETFETNIRGTYLLLEACRRQNSYIQNIVIASSDKAYGLSAHLPYNETMPLQGKYPYDVSKSCADLLAQSYFTTYGLPCTIARCANIYGGGDLNWSRLIPGTIRSFFNGESPLIRSDGTYIRDYIYVEDVVSAYMLLAENPRYGEAFNFATSRPHTVLEMVSAIRKIMGCEEIEPKILNQARAEIKDQFLSSQKAKKLLGWKAQHSLNEGLEKTIDWYSLFLERKMTCNLAKSL